MILCTADFFVGSCEFHHSDCYAAVLLVVAAVFLRQYIMKHSAVANMVSYNVFSSACGDINGSTEVRSRCGH